MKCSWIVAGLCALATPAQAETPDSLALDPIFTPNMVLQRGTVVPMSGRARQGQIVHAMLDGKRLSATADANGRWTIRLPAHDAATGLTIELSDGTSNLVLPNVAFGDVFLCSGQSNMEFTLRHATNADVEIGKSANADLRLFNVPRHASTGPQSHFASSAQWKTSAPESSSDFSAACYFFGVEVQRERGVPVGLIAASWGGSVIQEWLPTEVLRSLGGYEAGLELLHMQQSDPRRAQAAWSARLTKYLAGTTARLGELQNADITRFWEEWSDPQLTMFDGTGTYTASVDLDARQAAAATSIVVGRVDDIDQTVVNGKVIGSSMGWDTMREYALPKGTLRAGKNSIEVRALDTGGGGGMWGTETRTIKLGGQGSAPITGGWQFRRGAALAQSGPPPYVPWIGGSGLSNLFNGMIAPIGRFPLSGIAWYQGESNVSDAAGYKALLKALMADWRTRFHTKPFLVVQLANYGPLKPGPVESVWAAMRDAQRDVVAADPDAGLAVAVDVGDPYDIHPTGKQAVGRRLALALRGNRAAALPMARRDGADVTLVFNRPLQVIGNATPTGFETCNLQGCKFAVARLVSKDTVAIPVDKDSVRIRYLWADSPIANLFDLDGVPVSPFGMPVPQ